MKKLRRYFFCAITALGIALTACDHRQEIPVYPDSTRVFKKYYPENEIVGLAADQQWREVRTTDATLASINHWYDEAFNRYTQVDNRADSHCTRKAWQQGNTAVLRATICDHGNYRTILTIAP